MSTYKTLLTWSPLSVALICLLALVACGRGEPEVVSLNKTNALERVATISIQETDERFIGELAAVDVSLDPFLLYVTDRQMHRIAVVNGDTGKIVRFIGRSGEGPGELQNPYLSLLIQDRLVVADREKWSIFDTTGSYQESYRLPEYHAFGGMYGIHGGDQGYILPLTDNRSIAESFQASPEAPTVARLDTDFDIVDLFGVFPPLYQDGEYTALQRTLDVNHDSTAVVGYRLVPDVQLYDLAQRPPSKITTLQLDHPSFSLPNKEIGLEIVRGGDPAELHRRLAEASAVEHTYLLNDGVVVQNFHNRTVEYYEQAWDKSEQKDYAILGHINSEAQEYLDLPGPILSRDDEDRLYILLNHTPDKREIGIYEVNWP